jgi:hypothetical protein
VPVLTRLIVATLRSSSLSEERLDRYGDAVVAFAMVEREKEEQQQEAMQGLVLILHRKFLAQITAPFSMEWLADYVYLHLLPSLLKSSHHLDYAVRRPATLKNLTPNHQSEYIKEE